MAGIRFPKIKKKEINAAKNRALDLRERLLAGLREMNATANAINGAGFEEESEVMELVKAFYEEFEALEKRVGKLEATLAEVKFREKGG